MRLRLFRTLQLAQPRDLRRPLSAPGLRRPAAARHGRDGHELPPRHHRARRADDRARRDDADRGAGAPARPHPRIRHGRPLHHPRSRGGGADRPSHHGAAPRQDGRGRRRATGPGGSRRTPYATALVNERREAEHIALTDPPRDAKPVLAISDVEAGYGRRAGRQGHQSRRSRAARPSPSSANPAPARARWRASSSGCCRAGPAMSGSTARRLPPALAQRPRDDAAPHADGASDAGRRAQPAPDAWPRSSAGRSASISTARRSADQGTGRRAFELVGLPGGFRQAPPRPALGRPEAARLHRAGARGRARSHHLRRADLGARSARRRGGAEAPAAAAGRARPRLHVHHA